MAHTHTRVFFPPGKKASGGRRGRRRFVDAFNQDAVNGSEQQYLRDAHSFCATFCATQSTVKGNAGQGQRRSRQRRSWETGQLYRASKGNTASNMSFDEI